MFLATWQVLVSVTIVIWFPVSTHSIVLLELSVVTNTQHMHHSFDCKEHNKKLLWFITA